MPKQFYAKDLPCEKCSSDLVIIDGYEKAADGTELARLKCMDPDNKLNGKDHCGYTWLIPKRKALMKKKYNDRFYNQGPYT